ncbi:hypothetical protein ANCDUO_15659 [Ancylostoma duodenale]|uniref:7TM GPCR serpentine receptor class x (Srx) domain-containing protein n=1 Tax=Ancylostoma duodenale TaxID=51022 RepID=A0A0C2GB95_9BILA|nr:hypothetical protein ANCDUO_15659 [Ancylostoma duodenale]
MFLKLVIGFGLSYGILLGIHDLIAKCRFVYNPEDLSWVYEGCPRKRTGYGSNESERRRNVKLFWQGFAQELFFANDLIWQDFISTLINTRMWWFVSNTLMWELAHMCDGQADGLKCVSAPDGLSCTSSLIQSLSD